MTQQSPADNLPAVPLVDMEGITKRFPGVVANDSVHLRVMPQSFHAVVGENGAGKSTLLNILYGRYLPDSGTIRLHGEDVSRLLKNPRESIRRGVGLVSQHYALIPALTVLENIVLGAEPTVAGALIDSKSAADRALALAAQLGIGDIDLRMKAERLSVAAGQKIEILKALYRGAKLLLLDEPTATLAPSEAASLFALLRDLVQRGATVVFVTHKLQEVLDHSDRVTVLRAGRNAGDFETRDTSAPELLQAMIGERAAVSESGGAAQESASRGTILAVKEVTITDSRGARATQAVSLEVAAGEIVGVAGVDGSGQRELSEAIVGLRRVASGRIELDGRDMTYAPVKARMRSGIAYIPEDRHRAGMIMDFSIAENYLLGHETESEWGGGAIIRRQRLLDRAAGMVKRYDVRMGSRDSRTPARALSGGNQQKVVVARAMDSHPRLVVACQPTRGLDVSATRFVHDILRSARDNGVGVLLFSLDLDEILALSDRVAVMYNGRIAGIVPRGEATPERIGALMTGAGSRSGRAA